MIVLAALLLRLWHWPQRYEVRDLDEEGYLDSSLTLVEGITPGYKPSPAGPQIWLGWAYTEAKMAENFLHPQPSEKKVPLMLRPFLVMNRTLFNQYRDLSRMHELEVSAVASLLLLSVAGGFAYGHRHGGIPVGLLVGGLIAFCPIFVEYSLMSRPYSMGWSFGILAVAAAALAPPKWRVVSAGILLGLAIGSRVEMLLVTPLVLWEFWDNPLPCGRLLKSCTKLVAIAALCAYAVAPWLLTGLPGNIRAIGTIQVANPRSAAITLKSILAEFAWTNGFGPEALLFIACIPFLLARPSRFRMAVLILIVLALTATIFKTTGFGLHHNGPALVVSILACAWAGEEMVRRYPNPTILYSVLGFALALPLIQSIRAIATSRGGTITASADWVEAHVPDGSVVYTVPWLLKSPLPTGKAADAIWDDVTNDQAWRRKFQSGLKRFDLSTDEFPRAMSEENLVQERGKVRRWFILGSADVAPGPRYDLRLFQSSPVFGVRDVADAFSKSGGVLFWPGDDAPVKLGQPITTLHNTDDGEVQVYCSPDVHLTDMHQ